MVSRPCAWAIAVGVIAYGAPSAAATLMVGPGQAYATPCSAIAVAQAGDVIQVDASGNYAGDTCSWSTDNLTVTGVNGRAKIDLTGVTPSGEKGIFTIEGTASATIENFELSGAAISSADGNNGAGIRHQGLNLTVRNCFIHNNQDGILGTPATANTGTVLIENSEFSANGAGDGYSHNMYIGDYAVFTLQYSYSHDANVGHLVKSRAYTTYVFYNRLTDEVGGMASYETDIPNAGTAYLIGNIIEQSATTQNPTIVTFGEEGVPAGYDTHLFVVNNTILNGLGSGTFVNDSTMTPAVLTNDIFYDGGTITNQASAVRTTCFDSSMGDPMFVDVASYDVNLMPGSPCIDHGSNPGSNGSQSLVPMFEYVQPLSEEARVMVGTAIDIGAYEYGNPSDAGIPPEDAGGSVADSAVQPDGGQSTGMGGAPDAAGEEDGRAEVGDEEGGRASADGAKPGSSNGCGCTLAGSPDAWGLVSGVALLAAAMGRRRRRQGSPVKWEPVRRMR
jgi:MYXO-CTERM domain-containing protein